MLPGDGVIGVQSVSEHAPAGLVAQTLSVYLSQSLAVGRVAGGVTNTLAVVWVTAGEAAVTMLGGLLGVQAKAGGKPLNGTTAGRRAAAALQCRHKAAHGSGIAGSAPVRGCGELGNVGVWAACAARLDGHRLDSVGDGSIAAGDGTLGVGIAVSSCGALRQRAACGSALDAHRQFVTGPWAAGHWRGDDCLAGDGIDRVGGHSRGTAGAGTDGARGVRGGNQRSSCRQPTQGAAAAVIGAFLPVQQPQQRSDRKLTSGRAWQRCCCRAGSCRRQPRLPPL